jgi:site-specific DNA recombinase
MSKKTAALYARFSSDMQKDRSIDDQFALCREIAKREGYQIAATFSDRAKSGASMFDREGLLDLMKQAKQGRFSAVIVESLDRLSRDQEDLAHVHKRLSFHSIDILTNEGLTTSIHVGIRGIVGSMFLKDLGDKVRRGQSGRAREGKVPGSVPYGYRIVAGKKGEPEIDPEQAKIVRRIFQMYAQGSSPRYIAIKLTSEGIPSPAGGRWNAPTISGGGAGRYGILTNPLYIGQLMWNRTRRIRNPETGSKLKRCSPENQTATDVPHLRIIDQSLWNAAKKLREERARHCFGPEGRTTRYSFVARGEHLLAGMLRCGVCGGAMRMRSMTRGTQWAACAAADAHDACTHKRTYDLSRLQAGVLAGLRKHLIDPAAIAEAAKAYHAQWAERSKQNRADAASLRKQLSRLQVKIDRLVTAIRDSDLPVQELTAQLKPLEIERAGTAERLRLIEAEGNVVELHPAVIKTYQANVERLHSALVKNALTPENRQAFRNLIDTIVVHPTGKRMAYSFTPYGRLGALMGGIDLFPTIRSDQEIMSEQDVTKCDKAKHPNTGRPLSHIVPLGKWAA